jgi:hypothetical protein
MAITQIRHSTQGRAYYQRKRQAGKSHREALRALKRRLADVVYRRLVDDQQAKNQAGPGGHSGATLTSSAASPTPADDSSDKSRPGPATTKPTTRPPARHLTREVPHRLSSKTRKRLRRHDEAATAGTRWPPQSSARQRGPLPFR